MNGEVYKHPFHLDSWKKLMWQLILLKL